MKKEQENQKNKQKSQIESLTVNEIEKENTESLAAEKVEEPTKETEGENAESLAAKKTEVSVKENENTESLEKAKKKPNFLVRFCKDFNSKHKRLSEIIRFVISGGIATIVDWLVMGIILYCFNPSLYPKFYNVWIGKTGEPSTLATVIGTGAGFLVSLVVNYILSVVFVYSEKGNSKTTKGKILFAVLSAIGLFLNMIGMWFGRDVCHINEWIVKIIMTIIVLIYNYVTRKLFIFKTKDHVSQADKNS